MPLAFVVIATPLPLLLLATIEVVLGSDKCLPAPLPVATTKLFGEAAEDTKDNELVDADVEDDEEEGTKEE